MSFLRLLESIVLQLGLRIFLGGLFCVAAFQKLSDPQSFAEAIKGFDVIDAAQFEALIITGAYTIPWVEMAAGLMLILGFWSRAAALTIGLALIGFIAALLSVVLRKDVDTNCSCFGDLSLFCGESVGWCHVLRNTALLIPAGYLVWREGGAIALDHTLDLRAARKALATIEEAKNSPDPVFDR